MFAESVASPPTANGQRTTFQFEGVVRLTKIGVSFVVFTVVALT